MLAVSTEPLLATAPDGQPDPTDMTLEETSHGFVPANSPTTIAIADDIADGIWFGEGGFRVRLAEARAHSGERARNGVFYANADTDLDAIVIPETFGASLDFQLRSPASPEEVSLAVDLPAGARLTRPGRNAEDAPRGAVEVSARDGSPLGYVYPPLAYDADGTLVPAQATIRGNRIVVTVAHRDAAIRYPVTVDPSIVSSIGQWGGTWAGWQPDSSMRDNGCSWYLPQNGYGRSAPQKLNDAAYSPGMYNGIWGVSPFSCYGKNTYAQYIWPAPSSTYIYSVDFFNFSHSANGTASFGGIENTASGWISGVTLPGTGNPFWYTWSFAGAVGTSCCKTSLSPSGVDWAAFGLYVVADPLVLGPGAKAYDAIQAITVNVKDSTAPHITASPQAIASWTNDGGASYYLPVSITDAGLGAKYVTLTGAQSGGGSITNTCTGDPYRSPCPASATTAFSYTLPEGTTTLTLRGQDVVDNLSDNSINWTTKIDRSAPTISVVSGALQDAVGKRIHEGQFPLHVEATDPYSGTAKISIKVDGRPQGTDTDVTTSCSGAGCKARDWTFRPELFAQGPHTISVAATDASSPANTTTGAQVRTWTVTVNHAADQAVGPATVNLLSGNARVSRDDVSIASFGSPLTVTRTYNSIDPTAGASGPFGPGWVASLPVDDAGSDWASLVVDSMAAPAGDYAVLTDSSGEQLEFVLQANDTYVAPAGFEDLKLKVASRSGGELASLELEDTDHNVTVFTRPAGSGASDKTFVPSMVKQPVGAGGDPSVRTTKISWELPAGRPPRPIEILAPVPPTPTPAVREARSVSLRGPSGDALLRGNRTLDLYYYAASDPDPLCATGVTAIQGRLCKVTFTAWDPDTNAMRVDTVVARYSYDSSGRLTEAWDPRISPVLKEGYAYSADGLLTRITPPGVQPWRLSYAAADLGDPDFGRLSAVSRFDPALGSDSTTTLAYKVPLTGALAPYQMGAGTVANWGQTTSGADNATPTDATAVFPPDHRPATTSASGPGSVSGLKAWWKADAISGLSDGDAMSNWPDSSGNSETATQAAGGTTPKYRAAAVNGLPAVKFDGTDDFLSIPTLSLSGDFTILAVQKSSGDGAIMGGANVNQQVRYLSDNTLLLYNGAPPPYPISSAVTSPRDAWRTVEYVHSGSTAYFYENGTARGSAPFSGSMSLGSIGRLGFDSYTGLFLKGSVAELIVYDRALTTSERQSIETHLSQKYWNADYTGATVHYFDSQGRTVNVATPNGGITTTEYDAFDNAKRTLTAGNRSRILTNGGSITQLWTDRTYSTDGTDLLDERGPLHVVRRADTGAQDAARRHVVTTYSDHLPTSTTATALTSGGDVDGRTSTTTWNTTLRQPVTTVTDAGAGRLNLTRNMSYNSAGLVTSDRGPGNPSGGDAHETQSIYYTADAGATDATCRSRPEFANLLCKTMPGGQPATAGVPDLPVTTYAYTTLNQLRTKTEQFGTAQRVTSYCYDAGGRQTAKVLTTSGEGTPASAAVAAQTTTYDPTTGNVVATNSTTNPSGTTDACNLGSPTVTSWISRGYDTLGREVSYTDASFAGSPGVASTTTYDIAGRVVTQSDGKASQTNTYDATTGLLAQLTDGQAGTFTATYDADGALIDQGMPGGLHQQLTYDETGTPIRIRYQKTTGCSANCTWFDDSATSSIHGQVLRQDSTLSTQDYSYDGAGRLTKVRDTPQGSGCSVRTYGYDADSNRLAKVSRLPAGDGSCDDGAAGTTTSYSYDAGDRQIPTNADVVYDSFGRQTSLSGALSGGSGPLAIGYFANDLARTVDQDGVTATYELDPAERQRTMQVTGGDGQTHTYHYSDDGDGPSWTVESTDGLSWTRNVLGADGQLAAVVDSQAGAKLRLTNLHGDVVGAAPIDPTASGPSSMAEADEFGVPRQAEGRRYAWLGGKRRRTETAGGVIQMGARTYLPAIGRFTSRDPVPGGSANTYDYANQDPVGQVDLDGRCAFDDDWLHPPVYRVKRTLFWETCKNGRLSGLYGYTIPRRIVKKAKRKSRDGGPGWFERALCLSTGQLVCLGYQAVKVETKVLDEATPEEIRHIGDTACEIISAALKAPPCAAFPHSP